MNAGPYLNTLDAGPGRTSPRHSFQFITAIPLNFWKGSGCFAGIDTLARGIRALDHDVNFVTPGVHLPIYAVERIVFNQMLRHRPFPKDEILVGFDADGYCIAGRRPCLHVASIKGVMADVLPYEKGATWMSMALQARLERLHARRADLVVTPSQYCAERLDEFYRVRNAVVIPELIDLGHWADLLRTNPAQVSLKSRFVVLCVCRFYPRKRIDLLLGAAALLRTKLPELAVRIVGGGPDDKRLRRLSRKMHLEGTVTWLGDVDAGQLASEYNNADLRSKAG